MSEPASLRAGVARVVITPPVGIPMWGFGNRASPSQAVHDELTATALVLDDGATRVGVVSADVIALEDWHVAALRERAAAEVGVPPENMLISLTHTHSGPLTWLGRGYDEMVRAYLDNLTNQLVGAHGWASREARPARLGFGRGEVQIQVNRREKRPDGTTVLGVNQDGPVDREVGVLHVDGEDGRSVAALVNYACHPVILGRSATCSRPISSAGPARCSRPPAARAASSGCTGDLNPIGGVTDRYDNCERLGAILVGEALKTYGQIEVGPSAALGVARRRLDLPLRPLDPIDEIEREIAEQRDRLATAQAEGEPVLFVERERFLLARAERALAEARAGRSQAAVPFEVQALRLGDVGLTAAPAELFVEIGLGIKRRSPFPATMTLGYANGCFGYVPVAEAYPDGGYEVDRAHKGYGQLAAVAPSAAELIEGAAVELLGELAR